MKSTPAFAIALLAFLLAGTSSADTVHEVRLPDNGSCMSPAEWEELRAVAEENLARLRDESKLPPIDETIRVSFEWPLRPGPGFSDISYWVISGFPDHDPRTPDYTLDYACGARTYDGHNGTDYIPWPFPWYKMDHDQVEIVAAAAGVIFDKADGNYDHSCTPGGSSNKVAIIHSDGTRAWYLHMKTGSLTPKMIGQSVAAGEYLGLVGSSGNSGIPHLHFDVRDANWISFDPHEGACNPLVPQSWWTDQRPYHDSEILALLTHFEAPVFPDCPQQEVLNLSDLFHPGERVHYGIYHRDILAGQLVEHMVLRPDDSVAHSDSYGISDPHYAAAQAMGEYLLPGDAPAGTWKVAVDYLGTRYEHPFQVEAAGPTAAGATPDGDEVPGEPLRVHKTATDEIRLAWGESCITGDIDYEVYAGALGDFTSHDPVTCSTGGVPTLTFLPDAGDRYYLAVPASDDAEGSYGTDSTGVERQRVIGACLERSVAACP